MTSTVPEPEGSVPALSRDEARELAKRHGLIEVGVRPSLWRYLRDVWRHRSFLLTMASADSAARHQNNYLGQVWSLLNPILLGVAYLFIFGFLLRTGGDVENFIAFLLIGLFSFIFFSAGFNYGAKSIAEGTSMVRGLRFPRIVLPVATLLTEFFNALPAFAVLLVIALATGERPSAEWLLYPVALCILAAMTLGLGLIAARVVYDVRDLGNLIPLITRMLRYVSGVFFPVAYFAKDAAERLPAELDWIATVLVYQPLAVTMTMVRQTLMGEFPLLWQTWAVSAGWAVLLVGVGTVVFWQAEARYGRH